MPIYMPCPSTVKQHTHTPNLIHPPNLFSTFFFFVLLILLIFSLSSFLPLLFLSVTTIYLSRCPHQLFFFITFPFFSSWSFPLPVIPTPLHFYTLVDICLHYLPFLHLFFHVTFFFVARLISLSLSRSRSLQLTLSMWVIVQSCGMLKTWGDCQTDQ